ncbi:MAG: hypothetical protein AAF581_19535 [Planctomycetota bacterium]
MAQQSKFLSAIAICLFMAGSAFGGADVIVGELMDVANYGTANGYYAYAIGTESCNIGDVPLNWIAQTAEHPVIGQNMYRLMNGRFEHIGMSWLKHGFTALQNATCQPCTANPTGNALGVGCSDPYVASLNGSQNNGPRTEVNATTGVFPYPYVFNPPVMDLTNRRVRVHEDNLDPLLNVGAQYFVEGQYVTLDDAVAGNHHNNASHRSIDVNPTTYQISLTGVTEREEPAIVAWATADPTVQLEEVTVGGGKFYLGTRVEQLAPTLWQYEYALFNLNSDRSARAFTLPVAAGLTVTNIGFHAPEYHSGEETEHENTAWVSSRANDQMKWETGNFATNPNANSLAWGTLYNYRFTCNAPPVNTIASIEYFKPGTPTSFSMFTQAPDGSAVAAVSQVFCTNLGTGMEMSWVNNDTYDNITIRRDNVTIATLAGTATTFAESIASGAYNYQIVATIGTDNSSPNGCTLTVGLTHALTMDDVSGFAGQSGLEVPVKASSIAVISSYTFAVQYPTDRLTAASVDYTGSVAALGGADFMDFQLGADYVTGSVTMDTMPPLTAPLLPGTDMLFGKLVFSVAGVVVDGETRQLDFVDGLGGVNNEFLSSVGSFSPFTFGSTVTLFDSPMFLRGDCNSDGGISLPDAIFMLNYLFAFGVPPSCFSGCDVDDNGAVQLPDAIILLNYLFSQGAPPASPFPVAGADPTPDTLICL